MISLFIEGGALFMGMLSIVLLLILVLALRNGLSLFQGKPVETSNMAYIKSLGLFGFVLGMLGQFIGLFMAFEYIAEKGSVSPAIMAGGLKVSSITNIYGMIIFLISYLLWFALETYLKKSR
jgi:MotA/TolQ/ExbB proton channel family protein